MIGWQELKETTIAYRKEIQRLVTGEAHRCDRIPPTWNNNLRWHVGHLVTVPRVLTHGLAGDPLDGLADYRKWFAKGTGPANWTGALPPDFERLVAELVEVPEAVFDAFENRADIPFDTPYLTSVGVVLHTPAEALAFSLGHDGVHLGLILALKRGLNAMEGAAAG